MLYTEKSEPFVYSLTLQNVRSQMSKRLHWPLSPSWMGLEKGHAKKKKGTTSLMYAKPSGLQVREKEVPLLPESKTRQRRKEKKESDEG